MPISPYYLLIQAVCQWARSTAIRSRNRKKASRKMRQRSLSLKTKGKYTKYRYFLLETTLSSYIIPTRCQHAKPLFRENNPYKKRKPLPNPYDFCLRKVMPPMANLPHPTSMKTLLLAEVSGSRFSGTLLEKCKPRRSSFRYSLVITAKRDIFIQNGSREGRHHYLQHS